MYSSQTGSYEVVNSNVCQSCGSMTVTYPETASDKKQGIAYVIFGWMFAVISLLFMPLITGAIALLMGFMTYNVRSQTHGIVLMFFAAAALILGSLFSFIVAGTMFF